MARGLLRTSTLVLAPASLSRTAGAQTLEQNSYRLIPQLHHFLHSPPRIFSAQTQRHRPNDTPPTTSPGPSAGASALKSGPSAETLWDPRNGAAETYPRLKAPHCVRYSDGHIAGGGMCTRPARPVRVRASGGR